MSLPWLSLLLLLLPGPAARQAKPLLYLPLDGTASAVQAVGSPNPLAAPAQGFVPGKRGEALLLRDNLRFDAAGNFNPQEGAFACWLRPEWPGDSQEMHYLFSLYGGADKPSRWGANRWSVAANGGKLHFALYTAEGKTVEVNAPITQWQAGEWHHVAAVWRNVGSGRADGELRLYLDGDPAGTPLTATALPIGPVGDTLDIGRDSDGSPDYADAAFDEVYLYGRALTDAEIARAVQANPQPQAAALTTPTRRVLPGWGDAQRPYRARVTVAAQNFDRKRLFVAVPLDLNADLVRLGRSASVDPASLRVIPITKGKPVAAPLPYQIREGRLEWADGALPAGQSRSYYLYFDVQRYDFSVPLLASVSGTGSTGTLMRPLTAPDYATTTYGDAWDFDEGDTEAIDQWGNNAACIKRKVVENGVLKLDVADDPWFVWGDMWGQTPRTQRPVKISVAQTPILEMRVRQSVPHASWEIFGRPGTSDNLLRYQFNVDGTEWQTIRIDLSRQAHWNGALTAFRIDPTNGVDAHVEFDWVRLTPQLEAAREPVETLGEPSRKAARLALSLNQAAPRAGSTQTVRLRVRDAAGKPVSGQPVRLMLAAGSGGALSGAPNATVLPLGTQGCRALTGKDGSVSFRYQASPRAGAQADRLEAVAEFSAAPAARLTVAVKAGQPHHYRIEPSQPQVLRPGNEQIALTAHLVDAYGNPLSEKGRLLTWSASAGVVLIASRQTAADGSARAVFRGDAGRQWVTRVAVRDEAGLSGESAPLCFLPAGPRPDPVRLQPNGYFTAGGKSWLPLGGFYANWVGLPTPDGEWRQVISFTDATDAQIVAWLRFLKENGVTAERFMLRTHRKDGMEPMDIGGRVNPGLFAAVLHYLDLARPFGFRFQFVLHEDYTKPLYFNADALERYCLPWFPPQSRDALRPCQRRFLRDRKLLEDIGAKYTDPDVIACQDMYAREIIGLLKDNPSVFSYELENEMVNCPATWANHALDVVRSVDKQTPLCVSHGGGGLDTADPVWWKEKTGIDFYTYHLYPSGTTSEEMDYGEAVDVLTRYGRIGKPSFLGESAGDEFSSHPDRDTRRWTMRDIIWFSLTNGNPGCFFWNARGSEVAEFKLANEIAGQIDWRAFQRKRPAIAVNVPHSLADDKWFRSEEGKAAYAMMGRYARYYLDRGEDFDFVLDSSSYPLQAGMDRFAPPEPPTASFTIAPGYQLKPLVRADNGEALLYLRNFAGVHSWKPSPTARALYLRSRQPAPLQVGLHLPGQYQAVIWDLDTGKRSQRAITAGETLNLGTSDHDFAVHLTRE